MDYYVDPYREAQNIVLDYLKSMLADRHDCAVSYKEGDIKYFVYRGSLDPGTIKSGYIPKLSYIVSLIKRSIAGKKEYKDMEIEKPVINSSGINTTRTISFLPVEVQELLDPDIEYVSVYFFIDFKGVFPKGKYPEGWDLSFSDCIGYLFPKSVLEFVDR